MLSLLILTTRCIRTFTFFRLEGGTGARTVEGPECCVCGDESVEPVILVSMGLAF